MPYLEMLAVENLELGQATWGGHRRPLLPYPVSDPFSGYSSLSDLAGPTSGGSLNGVGEREDIGRRSRMSDP